MTRSYRGRRSAASHIVARGDSTLVEAELDSEQTLAAFSPPAFCGDEVTENVRFTGAWLANRARGG